jgi:hypothetical protein
LASITVASAARSGLAQFHQFGLEQDLLDQLVQPGAGLGGHFHVLHVARHLFDDDFVLEQALADLLRVASGLSLLVIATIIGTPPPWCG